MMKSKLLALAILVNSVDCVATDDLYLRTGYVMRNAQIADTTGKLLLVKYNGLIRRVPLENVLFIESKAYDADELSFLEKFDLTAMAFDTTSPLALRLSPAVRQQLRDELAMQKLESAKKYERPNLKLLPISVVAAAVAVDMFIDADDLGDAIENLRKYGGDTELQSELQSQLESQKNRKIIIGGICAAASLINLYFALQEVEVKGGPNSITISYNF